MSETEDYNLKKHSKLNYRRFYRGKNNSKKRIYFLFAHIKDTLLREGLGARRGLEEKIMKNKEKNGLKNHIIKIEKKN